MHKNKRKKRLAKKQSKKDLGIIKLAKSLKLNTPFLLMPLPDKLERSEFLDKIKNK